MASPGLLDPVLPLYSVWLIAFAVCRDRTDVRTISIFMRWSVKIARILGIDVKIHVTFVVGLLLIGASVYAAGGHQVHDAVEAMMLLVAVFACVLLHEFGHALAAAHYGIQTVDITLLPVGGVARLESMPEDPWQELMVAIAGPLVNVVIVLGLGLIMGAGAVHTAFFSPMQDSTEMLTLPLFLLAVNIKLVLFNLIPAFPMDGGRILRALLGWRLGHALATQVAVSIGQMFAVLFGLVGLGLLLPEVFGRWNPVLVLIAFFIYYAGSQEASATQIRDLTRHVRLSDTLITDFKTLPPGANLRDAVELLLHTAQHDFPVVDAAGKVEGVLTRQDLIAALSREGGIDLGVTEVMQRDVPSVPANATFEDAFHTMQRSGCPALPVVDRAGRLVGLVTPDNVGEMIMVRSVLARGGRPSWRMLRTAVAATD